LIELFRKLFNPQIYDHQSSILGGHSYIAVFLVRINSDTKPHGRTGFDHKAKVVYTKRGCFAGQVFKVSTIAP
jgi:hypothetical protein